mgnify:FL=1
MNIEKIRKFLFKLLQDLLGLIWTYMIIGAFALISAPLLFVSIVSSDFIDKFPFLLNNLLYVGSNIFVIPLLFLFVLQLIQEGLDRIGTNNKLLGPLFNVLIVIIQIYYVFILVIWFALLLEIIS